MKSVGNFGWALAQNLYSVEEMTERNYNGNGQKGALPPRRRQTLEEVVIENYGEGHMKQVRTAINTGIKGINYKIRNPISNEPSSKRRLLIGGGQLPTLLPATYKVVQSATGAMIAYNKMLSEEHYQETTCLSCLRPSDTNRAVNITKTVRVTNTPLHPNFI